MFSEGSGTALAQVLKIVTFALTIEVVIFIAAFKFPVLLRLNEVVAVLM